MKNNIFKNNKFKKEMADQWLAASQEIASHLLATLSSEADSASIEDESPASGSGLTALYTPCSL